jgi:hypothetical protein
LLLFLKKTPERGVGSGYEHKNSDDGAHRN